MTIKKSLLTVATVSTVALAGTGVASAADTDSSSADLSSEDSTLGSTDTDNVLGSTNDDGDFDWTQALVAAASVTTIATGAYYSGLAVTALVDAGTSINQVVTDTQSAVSGFLGQ